MRNQRGYLSGFFIGLAMLTIGERDRVFWASARVLQSLPRESISEYFRVLSGITGDLPKFQVGWAMNFPWYSFMDLDGQTFFDGFVEDAAADFIWLFSAYSSESENSCYSLSGQQIRDLKVRAKGDYNSEHFNLILSLIRKVFGDGSSRIDPVMNTWAQFSSLGGDCSRADFEIYLLSGEEVPKVYQPIRTFFGPNREGHFLLAVLEELASGLNLTQAVHNQRGINFTSEIRRRAEDKLEEGAQSFLDLCQALFGKEPNDSLGSAFLRLLFQLNRDCEKQMTERLLGHRDPFLCVPL